jgi:hypothetical protein
VIDIYWLGCKRSRVQIPAARPNSSSKTYRQNVSRPPRFGVHLESKMDASLKGGDRGVKSQFVFRSGSLPL